MHRCANSRRAMKRRRRRLSDFGPVRGTPLAPMHPIFWDMPRWPNGARVGVAAGFVAMVALVTMLAFPREARPHGPAEWIQRGQFKNVAGELCCGERDCGYRISGTVKAAEGGYRVNAEFLVVAPGVTPKIEHVEEFIPYSEAAPSPDGEYWRCAWGGTRKCFFAPPGQT